MVRKKVVTPMLALKLSVFREKNTGISDHGPNRCEKTLPGLSFIKPECPVYQRYH